MNHYIFSPGLAVINSKIFLIARIYFLIEICKHCMFEQEMTCLCRWLMRVLDKTYLSVVPYDTIDKWLQGPIKGGPVFLFLHIRRYRGTWLREICTVKFYWMNVKKCFCKVTIPKYQCSVYFHVIKIMLTLLNKLISHVICVLCLQSLCIC